MKNLLGLLLILFLTSCASVKKHDFTYQVDNTDHTAHVATTAKPGEKKPGVLVVHEWWGHNEYAKKRADELAKQGFVAMSIDMYGEGKQAKHPKDAAAFAKSATKSFKKAKARFTRALEILKARADVDPNRIAAIGYCFGGGIVLNMARAGVDLDLVASFHGSLDSKLKARKKSFKPKKVLVFNGAADPMVKEKHITAFKKEMKRAKADLEFFNFEKAVHAFTNPEADALGKEFGLPLAYDKQADQTSWNKFIDEMKKL